MTMALTPWSGPGALSSWESPRWFGDLRRQMDHLFDEFMGTSNGGNGSRTITPCVNVAETETNYEVTMDMPGMKPEDFDVEYKDGQLWVSGQRKHEKEAKGKTFHRVERSYGHFHRAIPLGSGLDPDKIAAEYKDGVLRLSIAKDETSKPKRITVKS